jgi:hypothetical protein
MKLATVCRVLGKIWLGLGGTVVMVGSVGTWYFHGWRAYQDLMGVGARKNGRKPGHNLKTGNLFLVQVFR